MPSHFPPLRTFFIAAQARFALTQLNDWAESARRVDKALVDEDATLLHVWRNWYDEAFAYTLRAAVNTAEAIDVVPKRVSKKQPTETLQKTLYECLRKSEHRVVSETFLCKRFRRWAQKEPSVVPWNTLARRTLKRIAHLKRVVPLCTLAVLLRSWLNGWCTARRFQEQGLCRLSSNCTGDDSLEHYARRKISWEWIGRYSRVETEYRSLARFLVLDLHSAPSYWQQTSMQFIPF